MHKSVKVIARENTSNRKESWTQILPPAIELLAVVPGNLLWKVTHPVFGHRILVRIGKKGHKKSGG